MTSAPVALPGIRRRLASAAYDFILLLGVVAAAFILPHVLIGLFFHITAPGPVLVAHLVIVLAVYFLWHWRHGGQTLAMKTWKIRLTAVNGGTPSWRQLILRFLLAWPSICCYGAGLLWALFDRDRQFLHDRLAGTLIVFTK
ncbi:MAG: RDD family protein [Georgfuchsia sp.]